MASYNWQPFLKQLSQAVLASSFVEHMNLPQEVIESGWLGFPGATEENIVAAETRLGMTFPPSYRAFLQVSNGWRVLDASIERMWGLDEIERFRTRHQADWIDLWTQSATLYGELPSIPDEDYLIYGDDQDPITMRSGYLNTSLEISDVGDAAILLLNPEITTPEGEWEAWFFATWLPGANRYRSFWDLMHAHYDSLREQETDYAAAEAKRLQTNDSPDTIRAKVAQLSADMAARGFGHASETIQSLIDHAEDATQLPARLTVLAQKFEQEHTVIISKMGTPPINDLSTELQADPEWQAWIKQAAQGTPPSTPPPNLQKKLDEITQRVRQQLLPNLKQNQPQREAAEHFQQVAAMLRHFLNANPQ